MSTFQLIPLDQILVVEGFNPRTIFDADAMKEMTASVKAHGILTPITVRPNGENSYLLVFGHRRFKAAQDAKLDTIPSMVLNGELADPQTQALVENVVRANLHPVDEGRALARIRDDNKLKTIASLARKVGLSPDRVKRTIRYASLPDLVNQAFIDGVLPMYSTDAVVELNKLGPAFCSAIVGYAIAMDTSHEVPAYESTDVDALTADPAYYLTEALDHLDRSDEWTVLPVSEPMLAVGRVPELDQLAEQVRGYYNWPWQLNDQIRLTDEDVAAALAYGCLVQIDRPDGVENALFVTDTAWFVDRTRPKLERAIELGIEKANNLARMEAGSTATHEGSEVPAEPVSPEAAIEKARAERKAEKEQRDALDRANKEFGANLKAKLAKRKPTADDLKTLALLLMYPEGTDNLYRMGWMRVCDDLMEETTTDSGRKKLVEMSSNVARKALLDWVCRPTNAEEVHGRLMAVLAAAAWADHEAVAPSRRYPNLRSSLTHLMKVARPSLPDTLLPDAEKRLKYNQDVSFRRETWEAKVEAADKRLHQQAKAAREGGDDLAASDAPPEAVEVEAHSADIAEDPNA